MLMGAVGSVLKTLGQASTGSATALTLSIASSTATIGGSGTGETNILFVAVTGTNLWHAMGSVVGNGNVTITGLTNGSYIARAMPLSTTILISAEVSFTISGATATSTRINSDWDRWIFASISNHFDSKRGSLFMFIEGQIRDTRALKNFFELRIDGPYYTEIAKKNWKIFLEVNCLVQSSIDSSDFHQIRRNTGAVSSFFTEIPVYKYGTGVSDDQTYIGCLRLVNDARGKERVQCSYFGRVEPKTSVQQATVEGHYEMFLDV